MVGPKKQDFWPRINICTYRKKLRKFLSMNVSSSKVGYDLRKQISSKIEARR